MAPSYELSFASSMRDVDRSEWDTLARRYDSPFLTWGFLALLEESGSIVPERGWTPLHALLKREGLLVAAAPLYAKTSSGGEFVWDFEFARVAEANGIAWYPKLVGMVPATPSPVWRVIVREGEDEAALVETLVRSFVDMADANGFGGFHALWPAPETAAFLASLSSNEATTPLLQRWDHQCFLWADESYGDFEGYLSAFSKNMRRNVLRERAGLDGRGIVRRMIDAEEAARRPAILARMADYYESTNDRFGPWAARWLERDFFLRLPEFLTEGWTLGAAFDPGNADDPIALSFLIKGEKAIWGRYWGASRFEAGLHFELCYYLPIEWALARGIERFDPGMGSEHKARRGFRSVLAPSFHAIADPRMARAFGRAMAEANRGEREGVRALNEDLPFRKAPGGGSH